MINSNDEYSDTCIKFNVIEHKTQTDALIVIWAANINTMW